MLLTQTATTLEPTLAYIEPAQTTCNYLTLFFRNLESALSESDDVGSFLRIGILALPQLPNSEAGPSSAPANGPPVPPHTPQIQASLEDDSFLHSNAYPNTDAPGQTAECEAGNEHYIKGRQVIGNDPGNQGLLTGEDEAEPEVNPRHKGISPIAASLIGIALLAIGVYFAFTKAIPFEQHYTINAVVRDSNLLAPGSPVRIGGVGVGKVTNVGRYRDTNLGLVQMQISGAGTIPRGRDDPHPPAAVPRGQLLRRPLGGDPGGACVA